MRLCATWLLVCGFLLHVPVSAQTGREREQYGLKQTFSTFAEYANDSSHLILGVAPSRKIGALGLQYERRLLDREHLRLGYSVEVRPLILESDPAEFTTSVQTGAFAGTIVEPSFQVLRCRPRVQTFSGTINGQPYTTTYTTTCGRVATFAQGLSPVGFRINLLPRHRTQITLASHGGYMFSTKPIPLGRAGSYNFTFEFGGGVEYFYASRRSVRVEYQIQHYSNHYTADQNPGVDSGFLKLTYAFGR